MQTKQTLFGDANSANVAVMSDRLPETVPAFRVSRRVYEIITEIKNKERRSISDVTRALLERGVAAFERDGLLFEPEDTGGIIARVPELMVNQNEIKREDEPDSVRARSGGRSGGGRTRR